MTYVVRRPGDRFELRESHATPAGPRARTLATFRVLDDAVIGHAAERARTPFDPKSVRRAAERVGAPVQTSAADAAARALIAELEEGRAPRPAVAAVLAGLLGKRPALPDAARAVAPWLAATIEQRGDALWDLLLLSDSLPAPRAPRTVFPRLLPAP